MKSRTSFYNPTVFKKNLTRFAPVWGFYTLCLVMGVLLIYSNGGTAKQVHFANNLTELMQIMGVVNLIYAAVVAQMLFGDLYSSRMCNALHAMPMTRECWFVTHVLSGIAFSVIPTAVMTAISIPMMVGSCYVDAWQIPLYVFVGSNLEFLSFFGMAVLACLCVGSRLTMAVIYGLVNFGAYIAYWIIDNLYTPMLYGVITPSTLAENLTPVAFITDHSFFEMDTYGQLWELFNGDWDKAVGHFSLTESWSTLAVWAAAGLVFLLLALVLYRQRRLECAGDAMAFKVLEPVFQVLCAVVSAVAVQFFLYAFLGYGEWNYYPFLLAGLVVGWFGCRMLIERSARVFRVKNWIGLGVLTAVLALSLVFTKIDLFGIAQWQPRLEDIHSVQFGYRYGDKLELTDKADIEKVLRVQTQALEDRLEYAGPYVEGLNGEWVYNIDSNSELIGKEQDQITDCIYAYNTNIIYTLKSGKTIARRYSVWAEGESGDIAREILSRWECLEQRYAYDEESRLEHVIRTVKYFNVENVVVPEDQVTPELARSFIDAVKADCAAGNMAQDANLHRGHFFDPDADPEERYPYTRAIYVNMGGEKYGWYLEVYPDSEHTLRWLREHDLLTYEIRDNNLHYN